MASPRAILVVDDDPHVREVLQQVFLDAGFRTQDACDGKAGLDVFRALRRSIAHYEALDLDLPE